jgi:DNA-binding protein H-NS
VQEIQAELARLRRQRQLLAQREQQLLRALAQASAGRVREIVDQGGLPAAALEGLLRSTVGTTKRPARGVAPLPLAPAIQARKAPLRFRHPDDPGLVWSGRGKTPRWISELQAQGRLDEARLPVEGS